MGIEQLLGQTLYFIEDKGDEIVFETIDGKIYKMYHRQSCCEQVRVEDISGDLDDLIGNPILLAREDFHEATKDEVRETGTWTFYNLATIKGSVTIRWLGESNGYYSETVDFEEEVGRKLV